MRVARHDRIAVPDDLDDRVPIACLDYGGLDRRWGKGFHADCNVVAIAFANLTVHLRKSHQCMCYATCQTGLADSQLVHLN